MPEGANVTTELREEHGEIERLVQRIASLGDCPARTVLVHEAQERFLAHIRAEQRCLYPVVERRLPEGAGEVAAEQREVNALREVVAGMGRGGTDEDSEALLGRFVLGVQRHIERQDGVILPQLLDVCTLDEINRAGREMRYALADERDTVGLS